MELNIVSIIIFLVVVFGAAFHSSVGMGFGILVGPILIQIDPAFIPGPIILSGLFLAIFIIIREHRSIDIQGIKFALLGRIFGCIIAGFLIKIINPLLYNILFCTIIFLTIISTSIKGNIKINTASMIIAGVISGIMANLSSIGGPPIALLYKNQESDTVRASLSGYFLIGGIISLITLGAAGEFGMEEFILFLKISPPLLIGFFISKYFINRINKKISERLIIAICSVSAGFLLIKTVI